MPATTPSHPRYPLGASLMFTSDGQTYPGNVQDLSASGLSFWAEVDLPPGEDLTLALTLTVGANQAKVTSRGIVRWKQSAPSGLFRYGTAFSDLSPAQRNILAEFLGVAGRAKD